MNSREQKPHESLNPYQANRLRITCQYIDKLLGEIEGDSEYDDIQGCLPPLFCRYPSRTAQDD